MSLLARELRDLAEEIRTNRHLISVPRYDRDHCVRYVTLCDPGQHIVDQVIEALERSADELSSLTTTH